MVQLRPSLAYLDNVEDPKEGKGEQEGEMEEEEEAMAKEVELVAVKVPFLPSNFTP